MQQRIHCIANTIKVALVMRIGRELCCGHSSKALHCVRPNAGQRITFEPGRA